MVKIIVIVFFIVTSKFIKIYAELPLNASMSGTIGSCTGKTRKKYSKRV